MEDRLPVLKGTDVSKDLPEHLHRLSAVLSHPLSPVGIGADGHDLAAQLLETQEELPLRKVANAKWAYDNIDSCPDIVHPPTDSLIEALSNRDLYEICKNMGNVLEDVSIAHHPVLTEVKNDLIDLGAIGSQMSGSGPTVFGIFDDEAKALNAKEVLWKKYKTAYICRPINSYNKR